MESEDVLNTLKTIKKLGINFTKKGGVYKIQGFGVNGFNISKNTTINAGNSGTLARLFLGLLVKTKFKVKIIGDKSLSKRDFSRVIKPLKIMGAHIKSKDNLLPIEISGTRFLRPIEYNENIGSAQVKSCIILSALNTQAQLLLILKFQETIQLFLKFLKYPIKIQKKRILKGFHSRFKSI